jgi:subtilase family serine protease
MASIPVVVGSLAGLNGAVNGVLDRADNVAAGLYPYAYDDYLLTDAAADVPIRISFEAEFEPYLEIFDAESLERLHWQKGWFSYLPNLFTFVPRAGRNVRLRISGWSDHDLGAYVLRTLPSTSPPPSDGIAAVPGSWSDALDEADAENPLLPGHYSEDILLDLPLGAAVQLSLQASFAAHLQILNSETQELVASDAQSSFGAHARLTLSPQAGVQYLARVTSTYPSETGPYTLSAMAGKEVDLVLRSATAPGSATVGQRLSLTWTVSNAGAHTATGGWDDRVYLSTDPLFDGRDLELSIAASGDLLHSGSSYTATATASLLATGQAGRNYLIFRTNSTSSLAETNLANNDLVLPIDIDPYGPDLEATTLMAPGTAGLGASFDLSYRATNVGLASAMVAWVDRVYFSADDRYDEADFLLGENDFANSLPLPMGFWYLRGMRVTVPATASAGRHYLLLLVNPDRRLGESVVANNIRAVPILLDSSGPDLTVASAMAPATAAIGSWLDVAWTVKNVGSMAAEASWDDAVFLSEDPLYDPGDWLLDSASRAPLSPLAAGGQVTTSRSIRLPSTVAPGRRYLVFRANASWQSAQGEANTTNNDLALPIDLTLDGPDLQIRSASAPTHASAGSLLPVTWTVTNTGSAEANAAWADSIYFSEDSVLGNGDVFLAAEPGEPLAVGASYIRTVQVPLPVTATPGRKTLFFQTNPYPYSEQGEINQDNNWASLAIDLDGAAPDLALLSASAPPRSFAGAAVDLSWLVKNVGTAAAGVGWSDYVFLSRDPFYDSGDAFLGAVDAGARAPFDVAASYTEAHRYTLPDSGYAGLCYLLFRANVFGRQPELSAANNEAVVPIQIDAEGPDLHLLNASAPAGGPVGSWADVSWTVRNRGGAAVDGSWEDRLYLSADTTVDASDTLVTRFRRNESFPLAAGDSYTFSTRLSLPYSGLVGPSHWIVVTNPDAQTLETDATNNTVVLPVDLDPAGPDLIVSSATVPETARAGSVIPIRWEDANIGPAYAFGQWNDDVYLSKDPFFDATDVFVAGEHIAPPYPLFINSRVSNSALAKIPKVATDGLHYLLFRANINNDQGETNLANNLLAKPIRIDSNTADLQLVDSESPAQADAGRRIDVSWTVTNNGAAAAQGNGSFDWTDTVYISADFVRDEMAIPLASVVISGQGPLAVGESYTQTKTITLPAEVSGENFLIFSTNTKRQQSEQELNGLNNDRAIPIQIKARPIVTVTDVDNVDVKETGSLFSAAASVVQTGDQAALKAWAVESSSIDMGGSQHLQNNQVRIRSEVSGTDALADPVGLRNSILRMRPGEDSLVIDAVRLGSVTGESVAIRHSFVSGNRGSDLITLTADVWGDRALVFGGSGNDRINCHGLGRDSFIQAGYGADVVALDRMESTPDAPMLQRPDGGLVRPSTVRGGEGFDVLHLRTTTSAEFANQAVPITDAGHPGWLFQGTIYSGFEHLVFG